MNSKCDEKDVEFPKLSLEQRIVNFFNEAGHPCDIVHAIVDDPNYGKQGGRSYGVKRSTAETIIEVRSSLENESFTTVEQIWEIKGLGQDTQRDIIYSFENH